MAQAARILPFPSRKITFKADDFHGVELLAKYDANRTYVVFCQRFLECSPQQMKEKAETINATAGVDAVELMINDFRTLATEYEALSHLFTSAAARLTAVQRGLA